MSKIDEDKLIELVAESETKGTRPIILYLRDNGVDVDLTGFTELGDIVTLPIKELGISLIYKVNHISTFNHDRILEVRHAT